MDDPHPPAKPEDWLALYHLPGLSLNQKHQILLHCQHPKAFLTLAESELKSLKLPQQALTAIRGYRQSGSLAEIDQDLSWAEQPNHHLVHLGDANYPQALRSISSAPLVLYVKGNPAVLEHRQIAMVGSRNPSRAGNDTARHFARQLASCGFTITSGLALGIDSASHYGALDADGITVAVMATGADKIYPARHRQLAEQIIEKGALVTEFPLGTIPRPERFPQRNRIISGLSLGILVVEAAIKSGSLISARFALEQGREVFAIPGSIHNPMSKGCHSLIRQGAILTESIEDILNELAPDQQIQTSPPVKKAEKTDPVLQLLDTDAISINQLVDLSGLSVSELNSRLIELELAGKITNSDGLIALKVLF